MVFAFHQMIPHLFRSIREQNSCLTVVPVYFFFSGISFTVKSLWQKFEIGRGNNVV